MSDNIISQWSWCWFFGSKKKLIFIKVANKNDESLIVFSSLLFGNLFTKTAFVIPYMLENDNEIKLTALLDINATGISFINHSICEDSTFLGYNVCSSVRC